MLKTAKVVGLNSDNDAALALILTGKQSLYVVISGSMEDAFAKIRASLAQIEESFTTSEETLSQKLTSSLNLIKGLLNEADNLQVLLASTDEDDHGAVLYLLYYSQELKADLVTSTPLQALLLRGNKKTNLCHMSSDQLVSGLLLEGDRVILTTANFIDLMKEQLEHFNLVPLDGLEDEVAAKLPEAQVYPLATIVIERSKEQDTEVTNVEELESQRENISPNKFKPVLNLVFKLAALLVPKSKRSMATAGIILLAIVLVLVGFTFNNKRDSQIASVYNQHFQKAQEEFTKSQQLSETDPQAAMDSLQKARQELDEALKVKPQEQSALSLKKQLDEQSPNILKIYQISDIPAWLDLTLIKTDFTSKFLSASGGKILAFDEIKKIPVKVNLSSKASQILAGEDKIGQGKFASLNGEVSWVYSIDQGIIKIEGDKISTVIKVDPDWGSIAGLYGFGGNLYLLDETKGQIWKYVPTQSGYSDKKTYLREGVRVDFSSSVRLQIDSSVWVLKKDGEILKFTQGAADFFSIAGLDKPLKNPQSFFVSDQTDNLYLLDGGNSRLLIFDKKGIYKAQYLSDKFKSFSDLVVDEKNKKVYLLEGSKIYLMDLK